LKILDITLEDSPYASLLDHFLVRLLNILQLIKLFYGSSLSFSPPNGNISRKGFQGTFAANVKITSNGHWAK